jgi:hypothetical protein
MEPATSSFPPAAAKTFRVELRLVGGERIELGGSAAEDEAHALARDAVAELTVPRTDRWPFFNGRFVRPDAVLSVDVVEE